MAALDHGVTVGDGVFETCKVVDGTPFAMTRHLQRLRRSADHRPAAAVGRRRAGGGLRRRHRRRSGIDPANASAGVGRLRITVTGGPGPLGSDRSDVPAHARDRRRTGEPLASATHVATVPWARNERSAVAGAKTTSYAENVVALAEAHRQGASEAILANTVGALAEGTGSNVFLVVDGELCTPSLATGCLAGITRALVLRTGAGPSATT